MTITTATPLTVSVHGRWVYTFSPDYTESLAEKIAGTTPSQARTLLLHTGVIADASIPGKLPPDGSLIEELDLGCHTLFLLSDGSIDLLVNDEQTPYLAENMLHLDSDETYRLFISLHEQFKQQQARMEEERRARERGRGGNSCNW